MFYEYDPSAPKPSLKDRIFTPLLIALGDVDPVAKDVDQIDEFGHVGRGQKKEKVVRIKTEQQFVDALKSGGGKKVEARIYIKDVSKGMKFRLDAFHHSIVFRSRQENGKVVEFAASFGEHLGDRDAINLPHCDKDVLTTYITAGISLANLKKRMPNIVTRLATSTRGVQMNKGYYHDMLADARRYHVEPWR